MVCGPDFGKHWLNLTLFVHVGLEKEKAQQDLGSHWTMKLWTDGNLWGGHFTCKELPYLNSLDTITEGSTKSVDNPMFGGKAKVRQWV